MTTPLLDVRNLSKTFGARKVVDDISFSIARGQTLGLLGPNGAGKSTTVSMICGLLQPEQGSVQLDGLPMGLGKNAVKFKIGLVPQDLALYDDLPARENLKLFGALYGMSGSKLQQRCDAVLELVNLADRAADKPSTFSGGMKRRLNIAAALLHDPELLILDEPTVGVDPQSRNAIFDSLEVLKSQGRTLIYTSHYMEEVERLADHIVIIDHGKVIANETPADLYRRLPAKAALSVDLVREMSEADVAALSVLDGVNSVLLADQGKRLDVTLVEHDVALGLLDWLARHAYKTTHFATAKTNLEDVFLTLTGRSLRD
ncbi:ABC transporter ATP-binding protein [Undibacterium sp. CY18W]|uniref:ABC transporter ATP-binding protein n=1 Tax=Undibacterium hunanense TaxID=2762292 RepID=A0ABR6ZKF5_9BURK|nr:ABC transporter ATP-binding protein [Undibacterium hunanense]MBC3916362.1 ABC transporter ATP-binding protein [Undibacterium hunanense]